MTFHITTRATPDPAPRGAFAPFWQDMAPAGTAEWLLPEGFDRPGGSGRDRAGISVDDTDDGMMLASHGAGSDPAPSGARFDDGDTPLAIDHFEFTPAPDQSTAGGGSDAFTTPSGIGAAVIGEDGRGDPGGGPQVDIDPDPAPPPVDNENPPEAPLPGGRPPDATPGDPVDTPPSPPPGTDNASTGRPPDAVPDDPPPGPIDSYTSGGPAGTSYNVTIEFVGTWTVELQDAFIEAAEYLSSIILSELPDAIVDGVAIDDISITATLEAIDGVGGVLGSAGPRELRNDGSYLPATGAMRFDVADAQNMLDTGLWESVVLHEMLHALGFGTLWSLMGLTTGSISAGNLRFIGVNATDSYNSEFPGIAGSDPGSLLGVPVETDGGPGTAGGHWDEVLFDEEIMTGYVDSGTFVSVMTIAALEDMGYDTVYDDPNDATDLSGPIPADPLFDLMV